MPGTKTRPQRAGRFGCLAPPGSGVVVRQRHGIQSGSRRGGHHGPGRFGAVGDVGVGVQVDSHPSNLRG